MTQYINANIPAGQFTTDEIKRLTKIISLCGPQFMLTLANDTQPLVDHLAGILKIINIRDSITFNYNRSKEIGADTIEAADFPLIELRAANDGLKSLKNLPGISLTLLRTLAETSKSASARQFVFTLAMAQINRSCLITQYAHDEMVCQLKKDQMIMEVKRNQSSNFSDWITARVRALYQVSVAMSCDVKTDRNVTEAMELVKIYEEHYAAILATHGASALLGLIKRDKMAICQQPDQLSAIRNVMIGYMPSCPLDGAASTIDLYKMACVPSDTSCDSVLADMICRLIPYPRENRRLQHYHMADQTCQAGLCPDRVKTGLMIQLSDSVVSLVLATNHIELLDQPGVRGRLMGVSPKKRLMLSILDSGRQSQSQSATACL